MKKKLFFGVLVSCVLGMSSFVMAKEAVGTQITGVHTATVESSMRGSSTSDIVEAEDLAVGERKEEILTEAPPEFQNNMDDETYLLVQQDFFPVEQYLYESLVKKGIFTKEKVDEIMAFQEEEMKRRQKDFEERKNFSEEEMQADYVANVPIDPLDQMVAEGIITAEQKKAIDQYYEDQMALGVQKRAEEHAERYRSEAILTQEEAKALEAFYIETKFDFWSMPQEPDTEDTDQIKAIIIPTAPVRYQPPSVMDTWMNYYKPLIKKGVLTKEKIEAMVKSDEKAVEKYKMKVLKEALAALVDEKQLTTAKKELVLQSYQNRHDQYLRVREKKQTKNGIEYTVTITRINYLEQMLSQGLITADEYTLLQERCGITTSGLQGTSMSIFNISIDDPEQGQE